MNECISRHPVPYGQLNSTTYVFSNRRNIYKNIAKISIFVGTFQTALEVLM
jgi:hypothetical protein